MYIITLCESRKSFHHLTSVLHIKPFGWNFSPGSIDRQFAFLWMFVCLKRSLTPKLPSEDQRTIQQLYSIYTSSNIVLDYWQFIKIHHTAKTFLPKWNALYATRRIQICYIFSYSKPRSLYTCSSGHPSHKISCTAIYLYEENVLENEVKPMRKYLNKEYITFTDEFSFNNIW